MGVAWGEIHPENYMGEGGPPHKFLKKIREIMPISMHGVGLSLGGAEPLRKEHLLSLKQLIDEYQPSLVSDHLAWCAYGGTYFNDLLPVPFLEEALGVCSAHISQVQEFLGRQILVENPSSYLALPSEMSEAEFLNRLCRHTGCGLLVDVNNIFVSSENLGLCAKTYIKELDWAHVGEVHLAGHSVDGKLRIDTHNALICEEVWQLFAFALQQAKRALPILIEWDKDFPPLSVLLGEAEKAQSIMDNTLNGGVRA